MTRSWRTYMAGAAFVAPALVLLGALVVYPTIATVLTSFRGRTGTDWVGLANYREMATNPRILLALRNNVVWVVVVPMLVTAIGLVFGVATERIAYGRAVKTAIFMPMAISFLASGVIWRLVYDDDPRRGLMNAAARAVSSMTRAPGTYAGAAPSEGVEAFGATFRSAETVRPGQSVGVGLVGLPSTQVPEDAREARVPAARPDEVAGAVFRDFAPGRAGTPGVVDPGELGLPGVTAIVVAGDGTRVGQARTDARGAFRVTVPGEGEYRVVLGNESFRSAFAGVNWLGPVLVTPSIIAAYIWMWAGFAMVVVGAGLAAIPRDLLEAARVDGADEWNVFRRITVPLLAPVLGVVFVTMTINVLKVFDIVLVVAPPGVQNSANVIALEMWRTAFGARNQGLGAAVAALLFVLVLPVMVLNLRRFRLER